MRKPATWQNHNKESPTERRERVIFFALCLTKTLQIENNKTSQHTPHSYTPNGKYNAFTHTHTHTRRLVSLWLNAFYIRTKQRAALSCASLRRWWWRSKQRPAEQKFHTHKQRFSSFHTLLTRHSHTQSKIIIDSSKTRKEFEVASLNQHAGLPDSSADLLLSLPVWSTPPTPTYFHLSCELRCVIVLRTTIKISNNNNNHNVRLELGIVCPRLYVCVCVCI